MNDCPLLVERDRLFLEKCQNVIDRRKRLDKAFDDFEMNVKLWEKETVVRNLNKSKNKEEILNLWERFKKLEKETRI
jgi:hypothetical protein